MKLTPHERRMRICELCDGDERIQQMRVYFEPAMKFFDRFTRWLPFPLRNRLREYPGMGRFIHGRMLTLICENMKFMDEE